MEPAASEAASESGSGAKVEANRQIAQLRQAATKTKPDKPSTVDWEDKLELLLTSGNFKAELNQAYDFLQKELPTKAAGAACAVRPAAVLQEAAKMGTPVAA
jgi:hypothetical protein